MPGPDCTITVSCCLTDLIEASLRVQIHSGKCDSRINLFLTNLALSLTASLDINTTPIPHALLIFTIKIQQTTISPHEN